MHAQQDARDRGPTCPPSTVYGAYNRYAGEKRIVGYPFNDHEGGQGFQQRITLDWQAAQLRQLAARLR